MQCLFQVLFFSSTWIFNHVKQTIYTNVTHKGSFRQFFIFYNWSYKESRFTTRLHIHGRNDRYEVKIVDPSRRRVCNFGYSSHINVNYFTCLGFASATNKYSFYNYIYIVSTLLTLIIITQEQERHSLFCSEVKWAIVVK